MHADRFGEVAVAGFVLGDDLPDARNHLERVEIVERRQWFPDVGELEHQQAAARAQDAVHFGQGCVFMGHVAQAEGDGDAVEVVFGERQVLGVALRHGQEVALDVCRQAMKLYGEPYSDYVKEFS